MRNSKLKRQNKETYMKKFIYLSLTLLLLCGICACDKKEDNGFNEVMIESSGNFSTEMIIEDSTDVTIVEMP